DVDDRIVLIGVSRRQAVYVPLTYGPSYTTEGMCASVPGLVGGLLSAPESTPRADLQKDVSRRDHHRHRDPDRKGGEPKGKECPEPGKDQARQKASPEGGDEQVVAVGTRPRKEGQDR